ncbi:MAG: 2-amino-4-hydroxy-6-hydroxymethyldihydropteridine diphosphokinase [Epsilonproteobacteria bacterium]|nr:2-amino-4-hydroxy-6-hydroxymethyldihydropteridine diphosphokinase [Campylobacterota bacterium]
MYRKRNIDKKLTAFYGSRFPYKKRKNSTPHRYDVIVGVGGNIGDMKRRLHKLFYFLQREKRVAVMQTSMLLKNPPFGYEAQDHFFNAVMQLKTSMQPKRFLRYLLHVEKLFGRKRSFANAPRTLDLDIIFFDNVTIDTKDLIVPHPHWHERQSVVIPLAGIVR